MEIYHNKYKFENTHTPGQLTKEGFGYDYLSQDKTKFYRIYTKTGADTSDNNAIERISVYSVEKLTFDMIFLRSSEITAIETSFIKNLVLQEEKGKNSGIIKSAQILAAKQVSIKELGNRNETLEVENLRKQNAHLQRELEKRDEIIHRQSNEIRQLNAVRLTQTSALNELKDEIDSLSKLFTCALDYELLKNAHFLSPCGHKFNEELLTEHVKRKDTCPICITRYEKHAVDHTTREAAQRVEVLQGIITRVVSTLQK